MRSCTVVQINYASDENSLRTFLLLVYDTRYWAEWSTVQPAAHRRPAEEAQLGVPECHQHPAVSGDPGAERFSEKAYCRI